MFPAVTATAAPAMLLAKKDKKKDDLNDIYIVPRSPAHVCQTDFEKLSKKIERDVPYLEAMNRQNAIDSGKISDLMANEPLGLASPKIEGMLNDTLARKREIALGAKEILGLIDPFLEKCGHSLPVDDRLYLQGKTMTLNGLLEVRPEVAAVLKKVRARQDVRDGILNTINKILAPWPASSQPGHFAPPIKIFE